MIPFRRFWLMYRQLRHLMAMDRLNHAQATAHAIGMAFGGKDGKVEQLTRREIAEALPTG